MLNIEFRDKLIQIVNSSDNNSCIKFIEDNAQTLFEGANIYDYYEIIKNVDVSKSKSEMINLIKIWLAFSSGDNTNLFYMINCIDKNNLKTAYEKSSYYSIIALLQSTILKEDPIENCILSISVLPKDDESIFMANAKLTYAQVLNKIGDRKMSIDMFRSSFKLFYKNKSYFLAVIAFTNEMMQRLLYGEYFQIIDECKKLLSMLSAFNTKEFEYLGIVNLPIGVCYYELNKQELAIDNLNKARNTINKSNLFYTYGIAELYLFKSYKVLDNKEKMRDILNESISTFGNMNYETTDAIIATFKIFLKEDDMKKCIENLELEYERQNISISTNIIMLLCYAKLNGHSNSISKEDIINKIEILKSKKLVSSVQILLIILAEFNYREGNTVEASNLLKEATLIYYEYKTSVNFYFFEFKCLTLLNDINKELYNNVRVNKIEKPQLIEHLSIREKEIIKLIEDGNKNSDIADTLYISVGTVKWHINNILGKLDVKNRVQAVKKAKEFGEI